MGAIEVRGLTRRFGSLTAVDQISFTVEGGCIFGLLGPNGAGKTTTISMLTTLLAPTEGSATVAGHDILHEKDAVRRNIGVVFQEPALDTSLTGRENLDFHAMMYGLTREVRDARIHEVLDLVELTEKAEILVQQYSGGMKRRLEIARGLIQHPQVLFLDEPTLGLDAQTRRRIWDYVKQLNRSKGVTIILTTHYMEEADYLCDRIAIIDAGRIVAMDTPARLKDLLGGDVISLQLNEEGHTFATYLQTLPWVKNVTSMDAHITLTVEMGESRVPEIVKLGQNHGVDVVSVSLRKPSLEDVFLQFTGRTIRDQEGGVMDHRRAIVTRKARR
ncbi:MAG: ATP-binding cassette domain-containing protein [Methanomicrobiales archaeon]|nr:ATP-binding cassette domain-containing protein [Methanomicrobiales archaeon]